MTEPTRVGALGCSPCSCGGCRQPVTRSSRRRNARQASLNEGVTAVLVDVVVRDRRGQPVRDLTAADFEVLEDGVAADDRLLHAGPGGHG